jgi:choline-sulfatase
MRILFIDIDTLRPDHLGCYGYHRNTSPNLDWIASQGCRFDNCYVSDAPCLPSRAALWTGRTGFHNGVINHGGVAADPFHEGAGRQFRDILDKTGWIPQLRKAGLYPVTVSPFGERHSAWWWYAGWREAYNTGKGGSELADDITPTALDWIQRNAQHDNWFLHVNYWDPHTPYRTPLEYGNPFANDPLPEWLTEEVIQRCWQGFGPHSAREPHGDFDGSVNVARYPRLPLQIDSLASAKQWIDGYDTGVWYADRHVGMLLDALRRQQVLDDLVIIVSSDHGENLGELNTWGDHQHADHITSRVPLLIRWPGVTRPQSTDKALHYHFDWAATMIELLGGSIPDNWDGIPFTAALQEGREEGRDSLVVSQAAWSCMRSVRFCYQGEDYICLRTYHDGYKEMEPVMLFNLTRDAHEQHDLSSTHPELVNLAMCKLADWQHQMMLCHTTNIDPMLTVLREGGPYHTRGTLPNYLSHLRATGRSQAADRLEQRHPQEAGK